MKKYLVIGKPIEHSLSPKLHNYWFEKNNIDANYDKKKIDKSEIPGIVSEIREDKLDGINVTVPFKTDVIPFLDTLSKESQITQSVNTIYKQDEKIIGHNTDIKGFELSLKETQFNLENKTIFILGAGGVVPSIIYALEKLGVSKITVSNRTKQKAQNLKKRFSDENIYKKNLPFNSSCKSLYSLTEKIRVELRNLESISNGIIIVVPSSTPNMDDEIYYEKQVSKHGYATAIVYGAEPRYQKKFTGSYTSSMILYDAIATIDEVTKQYGKTKEVILIGSSTGSLAIFKAGWQDFRDKYPSMNLITMGFMINAACPDISEVNYSNKIKMFAINGKQDESTPPWVCKNLKDSSNNPNLYLLTYSGGHHFESRMYPPSRYDTESAHALPTCSLNYKSNLHQIIKRRDGSKEWNGEKQGYKKDQKKWFGENCIDKGTLQGYEEYGANQFWSDVKSIIVDKKDAKSLKGYTQ